MAGYDKIYYYIDVEDTSFNLIPDEQQKDCDLTKLQAIKVELRKMTLKKQRNSVHQKCVFFRTWRSLGVLN